MQTAVNEMRDCDPDLDTSISADCRTDLIVTKRYIRAQSGLEAALRRCPINDNKSVFATASKWSKDVPKISQKAIVAMSKSLGKSTCSC